MIVVLATATFVMLALSMLTNATFGYRFGTIKRIEAARLEIAGTAQKMARIQKALDEAGIVFIGGQGPGVRLREPLK
jgi:hypothetical protein